MANELQLNIDNENVLHIDFAENALQPDYRENGRFGAELKQANQQISAVSLSTRALTEQGATAYNELESTFSELAGAPTQSTRIASMDNALHNANPNNLYHVEGSRELLFYSIPLQSANHITLARNVIENLRENHFIDQNNYNNIIDRINTVAQSIKDNEEAKLNAVPEEQESAPTAERVVVSHINNFFKIVVDNPSDLEWLKRMIKEKNNGTIPDEVIVAQRSIVVPLKPNYIQPLFNYTQELQRDISNANHFLDLLTNLQTGAIPYPTSYSYPHLPGTAAASANSSASSGSSSGASNNNNQQQFKK